jgi:hypothetical protein
VPPPQFYPHQPFYPSPPPPPHLGESWRSELGGAHVYLMHLCLNLMCVGLLDFLHGLGMFYFTCMNLCAWTWTWFVICGELCWLVHYLAYYFVSRSSSCGYLRWC